MDLDLDNLEVQSQYQDHDYLGPHLMNLKYYTIHHHLQIEMNDKLYLLLLWLSVDHAANLIQIAHHAL